MTCLETDFLVDILRGNRLAIQLLEKLVKGGEPLAVTPVTATELFDGAFRTGKQAEITKVDEIMSNLTLLEFDFPAARQAGELLAALSEKGQKIGDLDTLTAAIVLRHGHVLVTKNKKHFQKIHGLAIETW